MKKAQKYWQIVCFTAMALIIWNPLTYAQNNPNDTPRIWGIAGFGGSSVGWAIGANLSYQPGHHIITVRGIHTEEDLIALLSPSEYVWDIGALYGRCYKSPSIFASISGGISIVGGGEHGGGGFGSSPRVEETFSTVGVPIESLLYWTRSTNLGVGLYGFANLNSEKSFYGALLSVQIGNLR